MLCYTAVVQPEGPTAFRVSFPDLPGCVAASETWSGISDAAKQAMRDWFQGMPHIQPSALPALMDRPDIVDAIGTGALLLPVFFDRLHT